MGSPPGLKSPHVTKLFIPSTGFAYLEAGTLEPGSWVGCSPPHFFAKNDIKDYGGKLRKEPPPPTLIGKKIYEISKERDKAIYVPYI